MEKSTIPTNRPTRDISRELKSGEWDEFVLALLMQVDLDHDPFDDGATYEDMVRAVARRHDIAVSDVDDGTTLAEILSAAVGSSDPSMDAPLTG